MKLKLSSEQLTSYFLDKLIALKRLDNRNAQFGIYDFKDATVKEDLEAIRSQVKLSKKLEFKLSLPEFVDETSQNLWAALIDYFDDMWGLVKDRNFWERMLGKKIRLVSLLLLLL